MHDSTMMKHAVKSLFFLLVLFGTSNAFVPTPTTTILPNKRPRHRLNDTVDQKAPCRRHPYSMLPSKHSEEDESSPSSPWSSMLDISAILDNLSGFDVGQVLSNMQSGGGGGEVGGRGEIYVLGQFALIFFIVIGGIPIIGDYLSIIIGPGLFLSGVVVALLSVLDLGSDSLTPFLTPTKDGSLKQDGIYGLIRHPIYTGLLSIMAGISIISNSADRLILTAVLYFLIDIKASKEEDYLEERFAGKYEQYMEKVPGKFLPAGLLENLKLSK